MVTDELLNGLRDMLDEAIKKRDVTGFSFNAGYVKALEDAITYLEEYED